MKKYFSILIIGLLTTLQGAELKAQTVTIGSGTAISVFSPINRSNDYSVYEIIYLASEINTTGSIERLAYQRVDGTNVDPIDSVRIYMKHTMETTMATGTYTDTGYTLVYSGSFPNDSGSGWREVIFDTPFSYDGVSNLQVLTVKGYQPAVANTPVTPRWYYTNSPPSRARRYYGPNPITTATNLTSLAFHANAQLTFNTVGVVEITPGALSVYPVPSNGNIAFSLTEWRPGFTVIITDSKGSVVCSRELKERVNEMELNRSGLYFYSLVDNNHGKVAAGKFCIVE